MEDEEEEEALDLEEIFDMVDSAMSGDLEADNDLLTIHHVPMAINTAAKV